MAFKQARDKIRLVLLKNHLGCNVENGWREVGREVRSLW